MAGTRFSGVRRRGRDGACLLLAWAAVSVSAPPAAAADFTAGRVQGSIDTTVSHGVLWRVGERDEGLAAGANDNDGNLNYSRGVVSNTSKITSDLELEWGDFGAFARVSGFIDLENRNGQRERTPLSGPARKRAAQDVELLDAYATGAFEPGGRALDVRLGKHVLGWGESTFIQHGISSLNAFDVSRLRTPGAELREALVPVPMASFALAASDALTVEGFYQFAWSRTEIDPRGTYFSVTDYVGAGADRVVVVLPEGGIASDTGLGTDTPVGRLISGLAPAINMDLAASRSATQARQETQMGLPPGSLDGRVTVPADLVAPDPDFLSVRRDPDSEPGDSGQWGVGVRIFSEGLNGTEFGLFLANYHSRLPLLTARHGSRDSLQDAVAAAGAITATGSRTLAAVTAATTTAVTEQVTAAVAAGQIPQADAPAAIARQVAERVPQQMAAVAANVAVDRFARTGRYIVEYPEDLMLIGASFNTQLGRSGWALQGEYTFKPDAPLQRAEEAVVADGLAPVLRTLDDERPDYVAAADVPAYLASYSPARVQGYVERDVSQLQATATRVFGPAAGADGGVFLAEAAVGYVHDMPDQRIESPAAGDDADADELAWGYRMAARLDYLNAVGVVNLHPFLQFQHDVEGDSPSPAAPFVEGRTALTVGVRASYLSRWEAGLGLTLYGGDKNELRDRDFLSLSVKYSF